VSYKLELLYSPVYELLLSLSLYKRQTHIKYLEVGSKWPEEVEKMISHELKETIQSKISLNFEDLSVLLIKQCPVKDDITSFLKWMESMSIGEIYELLSPFLNEKKTLPVDLKSEISQYVELLKDWNEQYFKSFEKKKLESLKADAEAKKKFLGSVANEEIVQSASRFIIDTDRIKNVYLIPAYHFHPMSLVDQFNDTLFITYSAKKDSRNSTEVIKIAKALSDERRIEILRFLSKGMYTFTNIVKEIGMAKGNIHHHLSILRGARLVNIHLTDDENTFYYSTSKGFSTEFKNKIDNLMS
jgi:DNA-binding transcriptional ArsR family regulator